MHPTLVYPTAPINLRPQDIPGYTPPEGTDPAAKTDAWAWFRKDDATGTYRGLDEGMASLAEAVKAAGGVDAVLGFSQGGAVAGLVAAALETGRRDVPPGPENDWARALREANANKPLRFAVSYSGFYATPNSLAWCYDPTVVTPTLHVLGGLDTIVEESRSRGLVDRCVDPTVVVHPGGHHVPVSKEWAMALVAFVKKHAEDAGKVQAGL